MRMQLAQESQKSDDMAVKTASMIRTTGEFAMFKRIESSLFCNNGPQSFWLTYETEMLLSRSGFQGQHIGELYVTKPGFLSGDRFLV